MPVDVLRRKERKEFGWTFPRKLKSMGLLSSTLHFLVTRAWSSQVFCMMLENSRFVGRVVRDGFPEWQWGRRLSQVGKDDRKTSTNVLFCGKCLAGLEDEGILLCIGCSTRLLSSGKPSNNRPGCQLWFLGYSCAVFFSCLSFIPAQYSVDEDAISQQPMHLTLLLLWKDMSPFVWGRKIKPCSLSCIPLLSDQFGSESVMLLMSWKGKIMLFYCMVVVIMIIILLLYFTLGFNCTRIP